MAQSAPRDVDLPTDDDSEHLTALDLVSHCRKLYEERALKYLATAEYNERMCLGDQFVALQENYEISDLEWADSVPRVRRNLLANLVLTWSARLLEDRPNVQTWPAKPGISEVAAKVAAQVLDYQLQQHDFDDLCFKLAQLVQMHTTVGCKVVWDPKRGPQSPGYAVVDETTGIPMLGPDGKPVLHGVGEPEGDIAWQVVSVFDFGMPPTCEDIEDAEWVYFTSYMTESDARRTLREVDIDADPDVKEHETIWGVKERGVEAVEYWHVPCVRFPKGLFITTVSGHVVNCLPFPYNHGELPVAIWKCRARRHSCFGSSHVDDAVPIQIAINEDASAIRRQVREIASIKMMLPSSLKEAVQAGNQIWFVDDPALMAQTRYLVPPDVAGVLSESLEDNTRALYDVFGLSEQLTGATGVNQATAAKAIAYLTKLDSMKTSGAARNLGKMILRVMRQTLKLSQQYVQAPRLLQIAGESQQWEVTQFQGSDIAGVDVRLEPASGIARYRATVAQAAQDTMAQTGQATPQLEHQAQTGLPVGDDETMQHDILEQQLTALQTGQPVAPDPRVSPALAYTFLAQYAVSLPQGPTLAATWALLQAYQQQGAQAQQQQPPQQGQPQ